MSWFNIVGRAAAEVFARFEDVDPRSVLGSGDVKYHLGATGDFLAANGRTIDMHLVSNPSHLEAVDPVAMGRTRAKQKRRGEAGPAPGRPDHHARRRRVCRAGHLGRNAEYGRG